MDFLDMDDQVLPDINVGDILNQLKTKPNQETPEVQNKSSTNPLVDNDGMGMSSGDGLVKQPIATASTSRSTTAATKVKKVHEFIRILRPNLPRESKTKACKLMKSIAKGIIVKNTLKRTYPKRRTQAKRIRKLPTKSLKRKSAVGVRKSTHSMYDSSESCFSEGCRSKYWSKSPQNTCSRCGYSCNKIRRY